MSRVRVGVTAPPPPPPPMLTPGLGTPTGVSAAHLHAGGSVFHRGIFNFIELNKDGSGPPSSWRLMVWRWADDEGAKRLVVVNFSDTEGWARVVLPDAAPHSGVGDTVSLTDLLSGTRFDRSATEMRGEGLVVGIPPYSAHILEY